MIKSIFSEIKELPIFAKILLLASVMTVLSFFIQSALPPSISSAESDAVSGFLSSIIPQDTEIGRFIIKNIRKIGHFCEYGLFGAELGAFVMLFLEQKKRHVMLVRASFLALIVALIDETIQIFSGRGPSVIDVWLDLFGFLTVGGVVCLIILLITKTANSNKEK